MAFGSGLDSSDDMVSEINMTPLVDVMLVLLIIFIITVPVLTHSVKLDLPRADNTPNLVKPESVNISVTADGALHW
ncbi:biopolymer transporter ExbD, partial [Clostridium tyrobutyricum]|uniref:ExbD/TolR family protein n=1 Tax=Clostridium tyrobutyricum TaxID=1519 RepID=UPI001C39445B